MKKIFTFFLMLVASVSAIYASDIKVGGIWYDFDNLSKTATVTYQGYFSSSYDGEYSGSVVIPSSVTYQGSTYSVTSIGKEAFYGCSSLTSVTIGESVTSIGERAFYNCSSLTSVTIGESVTSIGERTFYNCSSLTSVTIPNSVTRIGDYTFKGCFSLTSVTIGESVTSIGESAFSGCSSLTSLTIPNSVRGIKDYAFSGCSSLTSVTLTANSVKEFCYGTGNSLLLKGGLSCDRKIQIDGTDVVEITIPNSVTRIGDNAFYNCSSLTSVTIGNGVTSIGDNAFYNCSSLTSVTIPNSVTSIGDYAFSVCSSLTSVTIGESVTSIGNNAFSSCSSLTSVIIGESVKNIGGSAFYNCSSLTKTNYTGNIAGWCNIEFGNYDANPICYSHNFYINDQEIKDLVIPNSVDSIHDYAFYRCSSLTSVTIGESVTSIGEFAFYNCSSLTSVAIGESVTSIGSWAFFDCSSLTSVTIPNSVTSIGWRTFEGCSSLTSVIIGESVKNIGGSAFYGCSSLTSVTIGESVTSIGDNAFEDCSKLTSVTINSDTIVSKDYEYVEDDYGNPSGFNIGDIFGSRVTEYIIGESVTSIGEFAFGHCSKLTSVTIGESVKSIGRYAFYGCSSLTKTYYTGDIAGWCNILFVEGMANPMWYSHNFYINDQQIKDLVIPNNVTSIGDYAFVGYSSLTSVTIGESVTSIGYDAFAYCSSLTSVTIGESVTSIGKYAFNKCSSLTKTNYTGDIAGWCNIEFGYYDANPMYYSHNFYINDQEIKDLVIPNSVDSIHDYAFYRCSSLTSVTIGESVTSIGWDAFYGCSSLTSVIINSDAIVSEDYKYDSNISHIFGSQVTEYIIGNHVKGIGNNAFEDCSSLTSVTIGESVTSIGGSAFSGCSSLISITCKAATPPTVDYYTFYNVSTSIPVYVPCESIQSYREHNQWGRFQNLQCVKPEDPKPEDPQDSEMCLNSADERAVFFQGEEFGTSANVYMWDPANDNKELVGSWPGSAATHLGDGNFKFVIPASVSGDPSTWMIIWNNGIGGTQTKDLTFTMHGLYNMSGVQGVITTLCDSSNTDDPNEEVITCAEAVSICQQTGTTATTKEYTIRGYVTKIEAAYSEQYDNITFWMADTSPMQMDNSSNSVTSISDYSNIALGKSTTASSSQNSGTLPEYINDGNFNTRWSSEWQDNEYITIDLEQYSFIDHITLHWETAYASQFAILITDEQPSSSALSSPLPSSATCYQSSGDVQTIPVAKSGRYITLIGIERATACGISLYELEAYGMPLLQAYRVKPIQSTDKYVQIGDYVEAVGTLVNYGGTTPEINAGGTYTILTKHEENGSTTSVENTNTPSPMTNCQKIIRNGQLLILRDGVEYTIMGQKL